ncbi:hypothetical protein ACUN24_13165 [Pedobacter sp. WC2501]|uniref:hypothetical protein n=1 Tax=Pedobacter sp. WC2501 TaxID=3461400 RepID=UPI004045DB1D
MMKILFSDDNSRLFEGYKDQAYKMEIDLTCVTNWEDAQTLLEAEWDSYSGLILDGKGQLNADSKTEDSRHVVTAIGWLKQQQAKGLFIPTIVYTAFIDKDNGNIDDFLEREDPVLLGMYSKNLPVADIFEKLIHESANLPANRIKHRHQEIFCLFDDVRLPKNMEQTMVEILSALSATAVDKSYYNKIRDILESLMKTANQIDKAFMPDELLRLDQDGRPNLKAGYYYLIGREAKIGSVVKTAPAKILNDHTGWIFCAVMQCSQILSHNYSKPHYHYAYQSTVFGLLEILFWYRDYLKSKYNK